MNNQIEEKIREQGLDEQVFVCSERLMQMRIDASQNIGLSMGNEFDNNRTHFNTAFIIDDSGKVEEKIYTGIMKLKDFEKSNSEDNDMVLLGKGVIASVNGATYDDSASLFLALEERGEIEFKRMSPNSSSLKLKRFENNIPMHPDIDDEVRLFSNAHTSEYDMTEISKGQKIDGEKIMSEAIKAGFTKYEADQLCKDIANGKNMEENRKLFIERASFSGENVDDAAVLFDKIASYEDPNFNKSQVKAKIDLTDFTVELKKRMGEDNFKRATEGLRLKKP